MCGPGPDPTCQRTRPAGTATLFFSIYSCNTSMPTLASRGTARHVVLRATTCQHSPLRVTTSLLSTVVHSHSKTQRLILDMPLRLVAHLQLTNATSSGRSGSPTASPSAMCRPCATVSHLSVTASFRLGHITQGLKVWCLTVALPSHILLLILIT